MPSVGVQPDSPTFDGMALDAPFADSAPLDSPFADSAPLDAPIAESAPFHSSSADSAPLDASISDGAPSGPPQAHPRKRRGSRYFPALDGMRAFAVIAVVLYHMSTSILPGGLLGVTMFFVLSGYLITEILLREWAGSGRIDLGRFWVHRVRRLFPAIAFMLCTVLVITAFVAPDLLTKLRNDLFAALFWFTNWWYVFQDLSYFEAMGAPSPVTHFWSLAIEEQFYLIWPPVLLLMLHGRVKRRNIQTIVLVLAAVSAALMAILYVPGDDPSRVYYGTDTRAFSLLIGAFLAFVLPSVRVNGHGPRGLGERQRRIIGIVGIACILGLVAMMLLVEAMSPFMYYGGLLLASVLSGGLVVSLVDERSAITRILSFRPLVYLGKISYGVYIWHYPIILLMTDFNSVDATPAWWFLVEAAVVLAVASFSYHFVEQPIRKGCLGRIWNAVKDKRETWKSVLLGHIVQVVCAVALVAGAVVACVVTPYATTQTHRVEGGTIVPDGAFDSEDGGSAEEEPLEGSREAMLSELGDNPSLEHLSDQTLRQLTEVEGSTPAKKASNTDFLLIGDSISATLSDPDYADFPERFPNAILNAEMNRSLLNGLDVLDGYLEEGWDGPVIIIELGTNHSYTKEELEEMFDKVPDGKMIFMMTIRVNLDYMESTNELLFETAANYDNVQVLDWYEVSAGHSEYFDGDGTHLGPVVGTGAFMDMIQEGLETLY